MSAPLCKHDSTPRPHKEPHPIERPDVVKVHFMRPATTTTTITTTTKNATTTTTTTTTKSTTTAAAAAAAACSKTSLSHGLG